MKRLEIELSSKGKAFSFPLFIGRASNEKYRFLPIPEAVDRVFAISDDAVDALHGSTLQALLGEHHKVQRIAIAPGETTKSLASLEYILERLVENGASRRSFILSFGGGMIGNIAGLAASLLYRGIGFAHLPTTLLAGSDSVVSLKQAVNGKSAKNNFGHYAAPQFAFFDFRWLETLSPQEIRSGLCEAIKNALAITPASISRLRPSLHRGFEELDDLEWIVADSVHAKLSVMKDDPTEQKDGLILEYGHTVGHAVELADRKARGVAGITHGEAVAVGMIAEATIASRLGLMDERILHVHHELVEAVGAPTKLPVGLQVDDLMARISKDNKRGSLAGLSDDQVAMVLLRNLGEPVREEGLPLAAVPKSLVREVLQSLSSKPNATMRTNAQADSSPTISIVIVTAGLRETLLEAIRSVFQQTYRPLRLIILVDGDALLPPFGDPPQGCDVRVVRIGGTERQSDREGKLGRVAHLRNIALELVRTPLVAFLDDDNSWAPNHLSSLFEAMVRESATAAHGWRRILDSAGKPAQLTTFPWMPAGTPVERRVFQACVEANVIADDGCTIRDTATVDIGCQVGLVDMGSWLLKKEALEGFRFAEEFSSKELAEGVGEDDRLLDYLRDMRARIVCTEQATLNYRLGGFSNKTNAMERRSRNIALSRRDILEQRSEMRSMPRFVMVELTRYCNLSCMMCRSVGAVSRTERMSEELFGRVETDTFPFADVIDLRGWGESLILPEFPDRLQRAARTGAQTRVVSNLSFKRDRALSMLADFGTYVGVSLDAADPAILHELRHGANATLIMSNLTLLSELYMRRGLDDRIVVYVTVQRPAFADLSNLIELIAKAGVQDVRLAPVTGCEHLPISLEGHNEEVQAVIADIKTRAERLGVAVSLTARLPGDSCEAQMQMPCTHPWTHCYVTWDGRIGFCDHLIGPAGDAFIVGSLKTASFHQIWNGHAWRMLREEHIGKRRPDAPNFSECSWCYKNRHLDCEDILEPDLSRIRVALTSRRVCRPGGSL